MSVLLFKKTDSDLWLFFFGSMLKLVTPEYTLLRCFWGLCTKKRRDLKMCFFLASLEPGCNEHRRTLILTACCAYMRRSRLAENMRLTPKLQVFYKHSWILQNTAGCDMLPAMQPNNVSVTACLAPLEKKWLIFVAVVAKRSFALSSENRMKNANTRYFQPFQRVVA